MNQLKQAHAFTLRNGIGMDLTATLIPKLLEIPDLHYAHKVFDLIPQRTLFLYNKLIQAYSSHGPYTHCFSLYARMRNEGCSPNPNSFTFLFSACASLPFPCLGSALHAQLISFGCDHDVFSATALVDMYGKLGFVGSARKQFELVEFKSVPTWNSMIAGYSRCGDMEAAKELLCSMPSRSVVSWTAMIAGYSQNDRFSDAVKMFLLMEKEEDLRPNEVTLASVLPACASLGALDIGQKIDEYARRNGYLENVFVCNALLEMYAKCGRLDVAEELFTQMGSNKRNLCSWNSMIMGLAVHGRSKDAVGLFHQMLGEGLTPDDVSFVGALMACTHGGMVSEGKQVFKSMERDFKTTPKLEHYGCMVDLLGRAGRLKEACDIIQAMPMKPDSAIWGALLGACSFHGNVQLAEKAAYSLFKLEPWNPGNYVILSNIYASAKRWDGVAKLRKMMKGRHMIKAAGNSFIELDGRVHKFVVEDKSHPRSVEIYSLLDCITREMKRIRNGKDSLFFEINDFV